MKGLYRFSENYGRMGHLSGVFVADDSDVAHAIGKEVYFGEVLGKHSSISCLLTPENLKLITEDANVVEVIEKHSLWSGHNPLNHIEEDENADE